MLEWPSKRAREGAESETEEAAGDGDEHVARPPAHDHAAKNPMITDDPPAVPAPEPLIAAPEVNSQGTVATAGG